jgi:peroxiredoxin Q/BCP
VAKKVPEAGDPAPDFRLPSTEGRDLAPSDFAGRVVVLYFYPKDMTSGCTTEACDFRDRHEALLEAGAVVLGVSPDSVASHDKFVKKHSLPFPLLADVDHVAQNAYAVRKEKSMYGRTYLGVERSTFLIDRGGILRRTWRKVKVPGHVEEVLEAVRAL